MLNIMMRVWQITPTGNIELETAASTLDEITRQLPDGFYSTFRTFDEGRRVLGLSAHLRRLYEPVSAPEVDESTLRERLSALLEEYRPGERRVRAVMTHQGKLYMALAPFTPLPREVYATGVRVETIELWREQPQLKSTSFILNSDSERQYLARAGIFEALLVRDGKILEGMTSNFFYVTRAEGASTTGRKALPSAHYSPGAFRGREMVLGTARDEILPGVTRGTVIGLAQGRGLEVRYEPLKRDQLEVVSEAFITSSSRGVVPVIQIDQVTIGQGRPGRITKELTSAYDAYVLQEAEGI